MKIIFTLCVVAFLSRVCHNDAPSLNATSLEKGASIESATFQTRVDTIFASVYSVLGYKHKDLICPKSFKKITPNVLYVSDQDSLFYEVKCDSNRIVFSHIYENNQKRTTDRNIILNNINCHIVRIIEKCSEDDFSFSDFMCDYKRAEFYESDNAILIKSVPEQWTGEMLSHFRFCQFIDKRENICYELFIGV
jgi:hypothetical protein